MYGVTKAAASDPPALVVLTKKFCSPTGGEAIDGEVVVLVGKGNVYNTGGLSLKVGGSMVGMKSDCGRAAGVLTSF